MSFENEEPSREEVLERFAGLPEEDKAAVLGDFLKFLGIQEKKGVEFTPEAKKEMKKARASLMKYRITKNFRNKNKKK